MLRCYFHEPSRTPTPGLVRVDHPYSQQRRFLSNPLVLPGAAGLAAVWNALRSLFPAAKTLQQPGIWGERVIGMIRQSNAPKNAGSQVVYEFLSPHPLGGPKPLDTKIGLFVDKITIDLFSLHIDLTGDLARRIAQVQQRP
jgi:hypothetical protein